MNDEQRQKRRLAHLLAAETGADFRTALRWVNGEPVSNVTRRALEVAAKKLVSGGLIPSEVTP